MTCVAAFWFVISETGWCQKNQNGWKMQQYHNHFFPWRGPNEVNCSVVHFICFPPPPLSCSVAPRQLSASPLWRLTSACAFVFQRMCKVTKDKFSYCPHSWRKGEFERYKGKKKIKPLPNCSVTLITHLQKSHRAALYICRPTLTHVLFTWHTRTHTLTHA